MFSRGIRETLRVIGNALLSGLEELGVTGAVLNEDKNNVAEERPPVSPACFASLNHFEILVDGKKLAGSAQKRTRRAFLQHGSVLIDYNPELFLSLLKFEDSAPLKNQIDILDKSAVTLNEIRGKRTGFQETVHAIRNGFQREFSGAWVVGNLIREEVALRDDFARFAVL